jgi:hypothetical protein
MMIVTDQSKYTPDHVRRILIKALINMDGVVITTENDYTKLALNYHEVKREYLETGVKAGHNLKNEVHFKACVYRASYLAKQDNKQKYSTKKIWNNNRITIKMIDMAQHKINSEYNKFLNQLVLWSYFYKRVEAEREKGFSPVKTYEKMVSFQEIVQGMLPDMEKLDRSKIRSYYPLLDDIALIRYFKDVMGER